MGELDKKSIFEFFINELSELNESTEKVLAECNSEYRRIIAFEAGKAHHVFLSEKDILNKIVNIEEFHGKYNDLRNKISSMITNLKTYYNEEINITRSVKKQSEEKVA